MTVFESPDYDGHEQAVFVYDADTGLKAIIAVHNTNLGPALGGCRMYPYETEQDAIRDVLRLSRGMTYKAAMAGVPLGGGKSVAIGNSRTEKTPALMHAMGRAIERMKGRYITGEDIGTNPLDMAEIGRETRHVTCRRKEDGGYGDPAPMTALGVLQAMRAGAERTLGSDDLEGLRVALQGVGNVGYNLCRLLHQAGAHLTVADTYDDNAERAVADFGADKVGPDAIYDTEAEIFAPCGMGAVLNDDTIGRLGVRVIAGAANNQLEADRHGKMLMERGITYLPDYVANGGGLICVSAEYFGDDPNALEEKVRGIYGTCLEIIDRAAALGVPTSVASDEIAEERFGKR